MITTWAFPNYSPADLAVALRMPLWGAHFSSTLKRTSFQFVGVKKDNW